MGASSCGDLSGISDVTARRGAELRTDAAVKPATSREEDAASESGTLVRCGHTARLSRKGNECDALDDYRTRVISGLHPGRLHDVAARLTSHVACMRLVTMWDVIILISSFTLHVYLEYCMYASSYSQMLSASHVMCCVQCQYKVLPFFVNGKLSPIFL